MELAEWFNEQFPPLEKHHSYARPSRRQSSTPDIPRPSYSLREEDLKSRTFGVVVDTSGSMSVKQLGLSLGAIASYAAAKEVERVRIVFCDADAHDAGYMTPEDLAGHVKVTGRGGTMLQPGVDLDQAKDFPQNGPVLIITDGDIENKLPFVPHGKVFYFTE